MPAATAIAEAGPVPAPFPPATPPSFGTLALRWYRLNRAGLRATAIGIISLLAFLLVWHLLTTYRVVFFVRFTNVPSPLAVYASFTKAIHDPKFLLHILLSCRRILFGFSLAAVVGVPLGLIMGRFKLVHEIIFPVAEVLRPIPAIAWVPMAIMLWPTNEQSIVFITFLGAFFPILVNTLHGMSLVDPVLVRAAQCLGARERSIFREVYFPASMPHIFTGLTVGMGVAWVSLIAAEMISGQYGIGYFTWEAYSLVQICRHRARHDRDRRAWPWIEPAYQGRRAVGDAVEAEMNEILTKAPQGHIEVRNFSLSYESIEGPVQAVTDTQIHEARRVRLDRRALRLWKVDAAQCGRRLPQADHRCSHGRRRAGQRPQRRARHGVSAIFAVSVEDGAGERRVRPEDARHGALPARARARARCSGSRGSRRSKNIIRKNSPAA